MDQLRLLELKDTNTLLDGAVVTRIGVGVTNSDVPMSVEDVRSISRQPLPPALRIPSAGGPSRRPANRELWRAHGRGPAEAPHRMFRATQRPTADISSMLRSNWTGQLWSYGPPTTASFLSSKQAANATTSPSAEIQVIDRSGHDPHLDNPDAVAESVVPNALGLFFTSSEEAADWLAAHPEGMVHSVEDDCALHREMMERSGWA